MTLKADRIQFDGSNVEGSIKEADNWSQIISNINIYKNIEAGRLLHSINDRKKKIVGKVLKYTNQYTAN